MRSLILLWTVLTIPSVPLAATVVTFDDFDISAGDMVLSDYQGFSWTNFSAYTFVPGFPGFNNNIVSQPNAAYSGGELLGNPINGQIAAATPFDFTSAYVGAGYYNNLSLTIQGFRNNAQYYSQTVSVSTSGSQLLSVSFIGIDRLVFSAAVTSAVADPYNCGPVNCTQFTVDDISLTFGTTDPPGPPIPPPPAPPSVDPEPSTIGLCALGVLALSQLRRCRRDTL